MTEQVSDQLKLLSDYTLFHIGLYASLISGLTALAHFKGASFERKLFRVLLVTVACFLVAGAAGGVIASNIPNYPKVYRLRPGDTSGVLFRIYAVSLVGPCGAYCLLARHTGCSRRLFACRWTSGQVSQVKDAEPSNRLASRYACSPAVSHAVFVVRREPSPPIWTTNAA